MIERVHRTITLGHKIPEYQARADYYKRRAVVESIKKGIFLDDTKLVDLIDNTTVVAIPTQKGNMEFAIDQDGICFARIEGGKFYSLNTKLSQELLDLSRHYEKLVRSGLRRILNQPLEPQNKAYFSMNVSIYGISDEVTSLYLAVKEMGKSIDRLESSLDRSEEILASNTKAK